MTNTTKLDRHCVIDDGDQTIAGRAPGVKSRVRQCKAIASRRRCRPLITTTPGGAGPDRAGPGGPITMVQQADARTSERLMINTICCRTDLGVTPATTTL